MFILGELSTLYIIIQYTFLVVIAGLALSLMGWRDYKLIGVPLALLFFMVPFPNFLYQNLSSHLQLISSQIGVGVIRLFGISVFLDGNVIDLGLFKLQVVEACSGLRYLFPLATLGFIVAYFFKEAFWKRAVLFLSTIPITVLMNSFRIGMIGIMVEYGGMSMAQGFIHDFEGWVVFMACTVVLVIEMWVLSRIAAEKRPLQEVFGLELPEPTPANAEIHYHPVSRFFMGSAALLVGAAVLSATLPQRIEIIPQRQSFSEFPMKIDAWQGRRDRLDKIYIDALKFDDYVIADFTSQDDNNPVNFYIAYYASQRTGESAHSPRSCIPGGGWKITSLTQRSIDGVTVAGATLRVNRTLIQKGENAQLVYYWFQQRGRVITNEYLVKWYLFWDALTRNRTDGALVRLTMSVQAGHVDEADKRLSSFARAISKELSGYIPE
jgi:exosortase D (VPLPA-CTERM-specific)